MSRLASWLDEEDLWWWHQLQEDEYLPATPGETVDAEGDSPSAEPGRTGWDRIAEWITRHFPPAQESSR
jgi:hypothetical protein